MQMQWIEKTYKKPLSAVFGADSNTEIVSHSCVLETGEIIAVVQDQAPYMRASGQCDAWFAIDSKANTIIGSFFDLDAAKASVERYVAAPPSANIYGVDLARVAEVLLPILDAAKQSPPIIETLNRRIEGLLNENADLRHRLAHIF